ECNGSGGVEIYFPPGMPQLDFKCTKDCLTEHENFHIQDLRRKDKRLCKGRPAHEEPTFDSPGDVGASEGGAYDAEWMCLYRKLSGLSDCDECRKPIEKRMIDIFDIRRENGF